MLDELIFVHFNISDMRGREISEILIWKNAHAYTLWNILEPKNLDLLEMNDTYVPINV